MRSIISHNLPVNRSLVPRLLQYAFVTAVVGCVVAVYSRVLHANPTTVALTFLLAILFVANYLGLRYSVYMSLLAALALNYFFLPPVGALTVADPQNWVALVVFLVAGVLASHLSERAREQTRQADMRKRELERLYDLGEKLFLPDRLNDLLQFLCGYIRTIFQNDAVQIYLCESGRFLRSPSDYPGFAPEDLRAVAEEREMRIEGGRRCVAPLSLGLRAVGSIGLFGNLPARETMEALGNLVSLAIERSMTAERLAHTEAARESERLRSALLDSVTHELRTPLTAITASITTLRSGAVQEAHTREELLAVIEEESLRLNRLIGQAMEMAQLDARQIHLDLGRHRMEDAVRGALADCPEALRGGLTEVLLPPDLPAVRMDPRWMRTVLRQLLENAVKYSEAGRPIQVRAEVRGAELVTSVVDRGDGIEDFELSLIFNKFYRGSNHRSRVQGTGMGLAIAKAIVEAHGGAIDVESRPGAGSTFSFTLPLH